MASATSSVLSNDRLTMRAIMKRPQSTSALRMDSVSTALSCSVSGPSSSLQNAQTMIKINKATVLDLNNLKCEEMVTTNLLLSPYMCFMNMNAFMAQARAMNYIGTTGGRTNYFEIHENAVRLDDIEDFWYASEKDFIFFSPNKYKPRGFDDSDLDLFAIFRESQMYNDCSELQQKRDVFFKQCLLQQIILYLKKSWSKLSCSQRSLLCYMVNKQNENLTVFDQLAWFGYAGLLKLKENSSVKTAEYKNITNNIPGLPSRNVIIDENDLAFDFGMRFSSIDRVIDACNKHFDKCRRKRMRYTKNFTKT